MYAPRFTNRAFRFFLILIALTIWGGRVSAGDHGTPAEHPTQTHEPAAAVSTAGETGEEKALEQKAEHAEEQGEVVLELLSHHLMNSNDYQFLFWDFHLPVITIGSYQLHVTKHTIMMLTVAVLLVLLLMPLKKSGKNVPHGFANFMEVLVVFIRDEVVYPNIGEKYGRKYLSFFLTAFFFILFCNLMGLVPWGSSATGNIAVTGTLAGISLLVMIASGMIIHGPFKYIASFVPPGVPIFVIPILFPIEIAGVLVKHFALCIRLFANMLAGHAVITVFLGLITSLFIAPIAILGAVGIGLLELFVAFLQAYIFVMLSSLFIGMAVLGEH